MSDDSHTAQASSFFLTRKAFSIVENFTQVLIDFPITPSDEVCGSPLNSTEQDTSSNASYAHVN